MRNDKRSHFFLWQVATAASIRSTMDLDLVLSFLLKLIFRSRCLESDKNKVVIKWSYTLLEMKC